MSITQIYHRVMSKQRKRLDRLGQEIWLETERQLDEEWGEMKHYRQDDWEWRLGKLYFRIISREVVGLGIEFDWQFWPCWHLIVMLPFVSFVLGNEWWGTSEVPL